MESLKLETVLYVIHQFKVGLFLISSIIHIMAISFLAVGENCFKILTSYKWIQMFSLWLGIWFGHNSLWWRKITKVNWQIGLREWRSKANYFIFICSYKSLHLFYCILKCVNFLGFDSMFEAALKVKPEFLFGKLYIPTILLMIKVRYFSNRYNFSLSLMSSLLF